MKVIQNQTSGRTRESTPIGNTLSFSKVTTTTMDLIYILDAEDDDDSADASSTGKKKDTYVPDFTMPGQSDPIASADFKLLRPKPYSAVPILALGTIPLALLIGAASTRPLVAQLVSESGKSATSNLDKAEKEELDAFLCRHGVSPMKAERLGYRFPPGHPKTGQTYRLHPLSKLAGSGKGGVYIPQDSYDELLLDEREAELIRLLVELGATRIVITEKHDRNSTSAHSASAQVSAKLVGEGKVEGGASANATALNHESREFKLIGKPWQRGAKLERSNFAWVAFEPSWGAMVTAREVGECTKAAIEIREETTFSSEKHLSVAVKTKLYGAGIKGSKSLSDLAGRTYYIEAEFAPFIAGQSVS